MSKQASLPLAIQVRNLVTPQISHISIHERTYQLTNEEKFWCYPGRPIEWHRVCTVLIYLSVHINAPPQATSSMVNTCVTVRFNGQSMWYIFMLVLFAGLAYESPSSNALQNKTKVFDYRQPRLHWRDTSWGAENFCTKSSVASDWIMKGEASQKWQPTLVA